MRRIRRAFGMVTAGRLGGWAAGRLGCWAAAAVLAGLPAVVSAQLPMMQHAWSKRYPVSSAVAGQNERAVGVMSSLNHVVVLGDKVTPTGNRVFAIAQRAAADGSLTAELEYPWLPNEELSPPFHAVTSVSNAKTTDDYAVVVVTGWCGTMAGKRPATLCAISTPGSLRQSWTRLEDDHDTTGDEVPVAIALEGGGLRNNKTAILCKRSPEMSGGFRVYVYDTASGALLHTFEDNQGDPLAIGMWGSSEQTHYFVVANVTLPDARRVPKVYWYDGLVGLHDDSDDLLIEDAFKLNPGWELVATDAALTEPSDLLPMAATPIIIAAEHRAIDGSVSNIRTIAIDPTSGLLQVMGYAERDFKQIDTPTAIAGTFLGSGVGTFHFAVAAVSRDGPSAPGDIVVIDYGPGSILWENWAEIRNENGWAFDDVPTDIIYQPEQMGADRIFVCGISERTPGNFDAVVIALDNSAALPPGTPNRLISVGFGPQSPEPDGLSDEAHSVSFSGAEWDPQQQRLKVSLTISGTSRHAQNFDDWIVSRFQYLE